MEDGSEKVEDSETAEEEDEQPSQPLTRDDVTTILRDLRREERTSGQEMEDATASVLEQYYPNGLSEVLIDQNSGKELRTPQDVVEASGGDMSIEEAQQWLVNEQFKLSKSIDEIKANARTIAENTMNFHKDSVAVLQKYEPLFTAYPQLQEKMYNKLMKQVKADEAKGVILSAPDVMEFYDDYLEPYQQAYEFSTNKPATNPTDAPETPPAKPSAEDRLDEGGDGGEEELDDPNDFAQQVNKELEKGF